MKYEVILFYTNSSVLRAESLLSKAGLHVKLIPTPRHLSSDCGIALRFDAGFHTQVEQILAQAGVEYSGIHPLA